MDILSFALGQASAGGNAPSEYLKNASVSGSTLTLTKQDDTTVQYSGSESHLYYHNISLKLNGNSTFCVTTLTTSTATPFTTNSLYDFLVQSQYNTRCTGYVEFSNSTDCLLYAISAVLNGTDKYIKVWYAKGLNVTWSQFSGNSQYYYVQQDTVIQAS